MINSDELTSHCLYFTANRMARVIAKMAEEEFRDTGLTPPYAFMINIINEREGLSQREIGDKLHLKASTITRFIEKLEREKLVFRTLTGKKCAVYTTERGKRLQVDIDKAWRSLHARYSSLLGEEEGASLAEKLFQMANILE